MRKNQSNGPILRPIRRICEPVLTSKQVFSCAPAAPRRLAETALGWRVRIFSGWWACGGEIRAPRLLGGAMWIGAAAAGRR